MWLIVGTLPDPEFGLCPEAATAAKIGRAHV